MSNNEVRQTQLEIFEEFKKLKTRKDKVKYCERMDGTTEHLGIKWQNLANAWKNNDWPKVAVEEEEMVVKTKSVKKEKKKEKENAWIQSYVDPVGQTDQEKTLTKDELNALL